MSLTKEDPADVAAPTGSKFTTRETGTRVQHAREGSEVNVACAGLEGERMAGCGRGAPAPATAALPCRNRNNCIKPRRYRMRPTPVPGLRKDGAGRMWFEETPGVHVIIFGDELRRGADLKRAFILRQHVEAFVKHWGRNRSLFFTTTDGEGLGPKVYAERWHSLMTNESDWILAYLRVLEPQRNGRPHFHNLVAVGFDTKPDAFNWEAFDKARQAFRAKDWPTFRAMRAAYVTSAAPALRELWAWGRRVMPRYGLGRCEILPIRKEGAISEYIGKYLDKGMEIRLDAWKGVRRFETDRRTSKEWKRCGRQFSWVGWRRDKETGQVLPTGAHKWRRRCGELACAIGLPDDGDVKAITRKLGPRWAYRLRGVITTGTDEEWQTTLVSLAIKSGHVKCHPIKLEGSRSVRMKSCSATIQSETG